MVLTRFALVVAVAFGLVIAGPLAAFSPAGVLASASEPGWQIVDDLDGGSVIAQRKGEDHGRRAADDDDDRRPRRGIVGIVTAKGTSDFTVDRLLGGTVKIKVDERTRYRQVGSGRNRPDFDDLSVGMRVGVFAQRIVPAPAEGEAAWLARGVELPRTKRERAHRIGIITALSDTSMSIVDRDGKEHTGIVDDDTRWLPTGATFAVGDRVLAHARWDDDEDAWRVKMVVKLGQPDPTPSPTTTPVPGATPSVTPSATTTVSPSATVSPSVTTTVTPSVTASPSVTTTVTPSETPSATTTVTPSVTTTVTPSVTASPSVTPSVTASPSATTTASATTTVTPSATASPSATTTASPSATATS